MWEFCKRFLASWSGIALVAITLAGALSFGVWNVPLELSLSLALVIAVIASYQLFDSQQVQIATLQDAIWSARHGTSLLIRVEMLPQGKYDSNDMVLGKVYIVNRRKDHTANVRLTLISDQARLEAEGDETDGTRTGIDTRLPNPMHLDAGANRSGYLKFPIGTGRSLEPFVARGVRLEIRDEQTGFRTEIELPTGPDGVDLIETRGER